MTLAKLTALLGSHALLTLTTGLNASAESVEQSNFTYDADFSFNLNGTYTTVSPVVPGISSMSPASGPVAGGNTVMVTGTGLTGTTSVSFCGTAATSFTVISDTQVTAVVPAGTAGDCTVTLGGVGFTATYTYSMSPVRLPPIPRLR